jgi:hypothetical protein
MEGEFDFESNLAEFDKVNISAEVVKTALEKGEEFRVKSGGTYFNTLHL